MRRRSKKGHREETLERIREGRCCGQGPDYMPWINTHDLLSSGVRVRARCRKTQRFHALLSYLEYSHFLELAADPTVVDIHEQRVLELERTLKIAEELGIAHPGLSHGREPFPMTTDFLVIRVVDGIQTRIAYTVKPEKEFSDDRVCEKFRIEERYWSPEVPLVKVTELSLRPEAVRSAEWILQASWPGFLPDVAVDIRHEVAGVLRLQVAETNASLFEVCDPVDTIRQLPPGTTLNIVRWMLSEGHWVAAPGCLPFPDKNLQLIDS